MKQTLSTQKMVTAAVLAALTVVGSAIRITLPLDIAGTTSFHLGNIMCALSGILLGPWLGGAAAGIGSALYDMFNPLYISEAWITFLLKFAYGLGAGLVIRVGREQWGYGRAVAASAAGAVAYAISRSGAVIYEQSVKKGSLEELFLELSGAEEEKEAEV